MIRVLPRILSARTTLAGLLLITWLYGCSPTQSSTNEVTQDTTDVSDNPPTASLPLSGNSESSSGETLSLGTSGNESTEAAVVAVETSGDVGAYTFSVTVESVETGCDRYANWWEVISEDGELLYRRVLAHSHVDEQPFTRSGGPVEIAADEVVIVRSHMYPAGYQSQAQKGSVANGFDPIVLSETVATELAETPPLPSGCAF